MLSLEACTGPVLERGARVDAPVALEDVGAGLYAGDAGTALGFEEGLDLGAAPGGAGVADGEDKLFDLRRGTGRRRGRGTRPVIEGQAEAAAFEPFVAGLARDAEQAAGLREGAGAFKGGRDE